MNTQAWSFAVNPFLAATNGSYANTHRINNFHLAALNTAQANDSFFATMYNGYKPLHDAFETAYANFLAQGGTQQGSGMGLTSLLSETTAKINHWDAVVQTVYAKGSSQYIALFPNGHTPFMQGTQENRIINIKALGIAMSNDAALSIIKTEVDSFYADLNAAFILKNNEQNKTGIHSAACDAARTALCIQEYANLGEIMAKFYQTPEAVAAFFDLMNIRSHQQTDFTHLVKPVHLYTIAKRTLAATDQIRISNTGNIPLRFYAANSKDEAIGVSPFLEVAGGTNNDYAASLLGDITNNHFIIVYNPDSVQTGSFVFDLL